MPEVVQRVIHNKIVEMIQDITVANGYLTDIREVNKGDVSLENIEQFPAVNVISSDTVYLNPENNEAGKLMKTTRFLLDVYMEEAEVRIRDDLLINLMADIEVRFCDDVWGGNPAYSMTDTAGNLEGTALIALPVNTTIFDIMDHKDQFGLTFTMDVKFRQKRSDPTSLY